MIYIYNRIKTNSNKIALSHDSARTKIPRALYQTPHSSSKAAKSPDTRKASDDFVVCGNKQHVIEEIYNIVGRMASAQEALTRRMDKIEKEIPLRL